MDLTIPIDLRAITYDFIRPILESSAGTTSQIISPHLNLYNRHARNVSLQRKYMNLLFTEDHSPTSQIRFNSIRQVSVSLF